MMKFKKMKYMVNMHIAYLIATNLYKRNKEFYGCPVYTQ